MAEVLAIPTKPADSISFLYNNLQATKKFGLANKYVDVYKKRYKSSIELGAFTSAILLKFSAAIISSQSTSCLATGIILREQWNNVLGNDVVVASYGSKADLIEQLSIFESQTIKGDNYSSRIRGYYVPPKAEAIHFG